MVKRLPHIIRTKLSGKKKPKSSSSQEIPDFLGNSRLLNRLAEHRDLWTSKQRHASLCVACKGSKMLCGKARCPVIARVNAFVRSIPLINSLDIHGASPPSVFVGRIGYPYIYAGPLVPPIQEDTSHYATPENWFGKTIEEIVAFRSILVRGKHRVNVHQFKEGGKIMELTRDLALASDATDVELALKKRPRGFLALNDSVEPFGPSAPIKELDVNCNRWDHQMEKAFYDTDLKAEPAVLRLYESNVMVTKIQRAFSVGSFGIDKQRRLVPTRWSITAVDSIISKDLIRLVRTFPLINEYRIYESSYLDNQFEVLMMPDSWSYEAIEAWYPGTIWNPLSEDVVMYGDWEGYNGRTTYASIGGCYYAARVAVCERLMKERRQATVVVLREARPGYIMPVGVWQVRENVRNAMRQKPLKFNTLEEALDRLSTQFHIPLRHWVSRSKLVANAKTQKKIIEYTH